MANNLSWERRRQMLHLLIEGNSVRSTSRLTGSQIRTILRHLVLAGEHCRTLMDRTMRGLRLRHVQLDEIWTFVHTKQGHLERAKVKDETFGDAYLFVALDTDTKLVPCVTLGKRNEETTEAFVDELSRRVEFPEDVNVPWSEKPQLSTDGWQSYPPTILRAFGGHASHGVLVKSFQNHEQPGRYGPPDVVGTDRHNMQGVSDLWSICTSHVERNNLTIRTFIRRFTRLSIAFSKKFDNLWAAICLHVAHYNFCRIHGTLKCTPAMAAGVTDRLWSIDDLFGEGRA